MRIIIDAMGGDNAPRAVVEGVYKAKSKLGREVALTLVGNEKEINAAAEELCISLDGIDIVHTEEKIGMEEAPSLVVRGKPECSMAVGMKLLKPDNGYGEVGDAFVSAGSTGALHVGSSVLVGRIKGVKRSCIAALLPFPTPLLLLDSGANSAVTPDFFVSWAVLGSVYMKHVIGCESPRVGLVNNGAEETKGTELYQEAHQLMKKADVGFVGNVEARDIPNGVCDVLVADGFTGNIVLKLVEGMGGFMMKTLKNIFSANIKTKLAYLFVKPQLRGLKKSFDSSEHGGAPIIGLKRPVIKAHGSADADTICNAVIQAALCVREDVCGVMERELGKLENSK